MFSYIRGSLEEIRTDSITVETGGVGWQIFVPMSLLDRLPRTGSEIKIFTSFQVREDAMTLYGFLSVQDREMFEQLLGISGIGPKAAMGILSTLKPDDLRLAVISEDAKAIAAAPGIGPKTARRVILELKDRIRRENILPQGDGAAANADAASIHPQDALNGADGAVREAVEALTALGYSLTEATRAVRQVELTDGMDAEAVLKASLRFLAF